MGIAKAMKINLIYLPHPYLVRPSMMAPLGLMYFAAALEREGQTVSIKNYSGWTVEDAINGLDEADMYGITVTSLELGDANSFAGKIKDKFTYAKVVLGGPGTLTPDFVDWNVIDSIVQGEGETITGTLIKDINNLQKVYVSRTEKDLDKIPFPARHLIGGEFSTLSVMTSRGCPFNCAFCASPQLTHRAMRYRSADSVMEELKKHKFENLVIYDDMFTSKRQHMIDICSMIADLGIKFRMNIRAKPLDIEMLEIAKDAGCIEAAVGVESFDDDVLKTLNKKTSVADNVNALWMLDKVGIPSRLLLMIRTPGQTKSTMGRNKYWLQRLPYKMVACTNLIPIPGCDIWNNPDKYNIEILNRKLEDYNYGFFDSEGEIPLLPIFKIKDRSLEEFHQETTEFKDWLVSEIIVNKG